MKGRQFRPCSLVSGNAHFIAPEIPHLNLPQVRHFPLRSVVFPLAKCGISPCEVWYLLKFQIGLSFLAKLTERDCPEWLKTISFSVFKVCYKLFQFLDTNIPEFDWGTMS